MLPLLNSLSDRFQHRIPARWWHARRALAPVRPIVVIQSDDWGRVGTPDIIALDKVRTLGYAVGESPWDFYGLESTKDLEALCSRLQMMRDQDGTPACIVANFILANPDLRRMVQEGYRQIRWLDLSEELPSPWSEKGLLNSYRALIKAGVFSPALHGFCHFNEVAWWAALRNADSDVGHRARALVENDIPYLASLTPELNFALVARNENQEVFRVRAEQLVWVRDGVRLFTKAFGRAPVSTCAPGYRCDSTTFDAWQASGLKVVQTAAARWPFMQKGMLVLSRNVFFEPVLDDVNPVECALERAAVAVAAGLPVIICSHSINYMERHHGRAEYGRDCLSSLLSGLLQRFPQLRFSNDEQVLKSFVANDSDWWRSPSPSEIRARVAGGFS